MVARVQALRSTVRRKAASGRPPARHVIRITPRRRHNSSRAADQYACGTLAHAPGVAEVVPRDQEHLLDAVVRGSPIRSRSIFQRSPTAAWAGSLPSLSHGMSKASRRGTAWRTAPARCRASGRLAGRRSSPAGSPRHRDATDPRAAPPRGQAQQHGAGTGLAGAARQLAFGARQVGERRRLPVRGCASARCRAPQTVGSAAQCAARGAARYPRNVCNLV